MAAYLKSAPTKSFGDTAQQDVADRVRTIIADIRSDGDSAVRRYAQQFDNWAPDAFRLDDEAVDEIMATLDPQVIEDIVFVQEQVRTFAQAQRDSLVDIEVETLPGVHLGQKHVPVQAAGAYIPGGKYPLTASAHMTIITAKVAGRSARRRVHSPDPWRDPRRHRRGDEARRRGRDLHPRRRPGCGRDGHRHRDDRTREPHRRSRQRLCRRGEAPAVRRGRHRPVRRPDRDPHHRRRERRPVPHGGRPPLAGRARTRVPRRARDDLAQRSANR